MAPAPPTSLGVRWVEGRRTQAGRHGPAFSPRRVPPLQRHVGRAQGGRRRATHGGKGTSPAAAGTAAAGALLLRAGPPNGLAVAARQRAQGGILDGRLVVGGERQLDEAKVVLEDLGVALDRGLPVFVDSPLERGLCVGYLVGVRRGIVVVKGVGGYLLEMGCVGILAALGEQTEILEDVVLGVGADPRPGMAECTASARPRPRLMRRQAQGVCAHSKARSLCGMEHEGSRRTNLMSE